MYERVIKRLMDILLCSFALIVLFPLLLITAIGIKLSSPGPVLYYSDRTGKAHKKFVANNICTVDVDKKSLKTRAIYSRYLYILHKQTTSRFESVLFRQLLPDIWARSYDG